MNQQLLDRRVEYLLSLDTGLEHIDDRPERIYYYSGFLYAVLIWDTSPNPNTAFRRVVDAKKEGVVMDQSDEFIEGYDKALRIFREAKGLS